METIPKPEDTTAGDRTVSLAAQHEITDILAELHRDPEPFPGEFRPPSTILEEDLEGDAADGIPDEGAGTRSDGPTAKVLFSAEAWTQEAAADQQQVPMEQRASGAGSLKHKLSETRRNKEPDPLSAWNIQPEPDDGIGASALAEAYSKRVEDLAAAGKLAKGERVTACEVGTQTGIGAKTFLAGVQKYDEKNGTQVYERTKMVLTGTEERVGAIQESGMFRDHPNVTYLTDTDGLDLPTDTLAVLLDRTTNRSPVHRLVNDVTSQPSEAEEPLVREFEDTLAILRGKTPLVTVDAQTGQAQTVYPSSMRRGLYVDAASGTEEVSELVPKLVGRAVVIEGGYATDDPQLAYEARVAELDAMQAQGLIEDGAVRQEIQKAYRRLVASSRYASLGNGIRRQEDTVHEFMGEAPTKRVFNFAPDTTTLIETVTRGVRKDAIFLVSGPQRSGTELKMPRGAPLTIDQGPLTEYVTEGRQVELAVAAVDPAARITKSHNDPGDHGYMLVDRDPDPGRARAAQEVFEKALSTPRLDTKVFLTSAHRKLEAFQDGNADLLAEAASAINKKYEEAVKVDPQAEQNYTLARELAREFNAFGLPAEALVHAERAARILPLTSAPQIEIAIAALATNKIDQAEIALAKARQASPDNAEVYRTSINLRLKQGDLPGYIEDLSNFLRCAPELSVKETVESLKKLCGAMEADWRQNADNHEKFKTVLVENTQTGERTLQEVSVATIKQVMAADAWRTTREAVGELLDQEAYTTGTRQERDRITNELIDGYERTRFRMPDPRHPGYFLDDPLPRDEWADRPPADSPSRLIYAGMMHESDTQVSPREVYGMLHNQAVEVRSVAPDTVDELEEYTVPLRKSVEVGEILDSAGDPTGSYLSISKKDIGRHTFIAGRSGSGKTEGVKDMAKQLQEMGVKVLLIEFGQKAGEYDDMPARLEGISSMGVIRPGIDDVSLDMYTPTGGPEISQAKAVQDTIDRIVDIWKTAYDMPEPFGDLLKNGLTRIYADNGWDVGQPEIFPVSGMMPTLPTTEQLEKAVAIEVENYSDEQGGSEAKRTIAGFFSTRFKSLRRPPVGNTLEGRNPLDWEQIVKGDYIIDLAGIKDEDDRRLIGLALVKQYTNYLWETRRPNNREVENVIIIDEAQVAVGAAKEGELARAESVAKLSTELRQIRAIGASFCIVTQTANGVHPDFLSQNAARISYAQQERSDKEDTSGAMTSTDERFVEAKRMLHELEVGQALVWTDGMGMPTRVQVAYDRANVPDDEAIARGLRNQPPLPIKAMASEYQAVANAATAPEQALVRLFVTAGVLLPHIAGTELAPKVPAEVKTWWDETSAQNPEYARRVLGTIVGKAVNERAMAMRESCDPADMATRVLATAEGMLNGEPTGRGRFPSASSTLPQVVWMKLHEQLTSPYLRPAPPPHNLAQPLPHHLPGMEERPGEFVDDQILRLRQHKVSPVGPPPLRAENKKRAWDAILGQNDGAQIWDDLSLVDDDTGKRHTTPESAKLVQRRQLARVLGYTTMNDPRPNDLERVLALAAQAQIE
jgi:tetratricopeptide (TPR) repeat protein